MNVRLKRIEATLDQLSQRHRAIAPGRQSLTVRSVALQGSLSSTARTSISLPGYPSFVIEPKPAPTPRLTVNDVVQPLRLHDEVLQAPNLPRFKMPSFTSHDNAANPALSLGLLHELGTILRKWQVDLQGVLLQIQELYLEGPIVDGWLESMAGNSSDGETPSSKGMAQSTPKATTGTESKPGSGYRLCWLDADGKLSSRPCPPDQIPQVSLAIARYQKLRQLMSRRHHLETRFSQLAKTLIALHQRLQEMD